MALDDISIENCIIFSESIKYSHLRQLFRKTQVADTALFHAGIAQKKTLRRCMDAKNPIYIYTMQTDTLYFVERHTHTHTMYARAHTHTHTHTIYAHTHTHIHTMYACAHTHTVYARTRTHTYIHTILIYVAHYTMSRATCLWQTVYR
jgi:hypothetical protein